MRDTRSLKFYQIGPHQKVKLKLFLYSPEHTLRVSKNLRFPGEGGKVVRPTHWPPLISGDCHGTHFYYRLSRLQALSVGGMDYVNEKSQ
jgi:hypothetical protein